MTNLVALDCYNRFMVDLSLENNILVCYPPSKLSPDDALVFAAWLVANAEHCASVTFSHVLKRVKDA